MKDKINEIRISYKERTPSPSWQKINSSKDAADLLFEHWDKQTIQVHESFKLVLLNNNNKVKGFYQLSKGGITPAIIDIRILFTVVLKSLSVAIILTHNHPNGTLKASESDKDITQRIKYDRAMRKLEEIKERLQYVLNQIEPVSNRFGKDFLKIEITPEEWARFKQMLKDS